MSKFSPRYLALSAPLVLLLSVLHTPANALPVPILTCTVLPAACCLLPADGVCPGGPFGTPTEGWDGAGLGAVTIEVAPFLWTAKPDSISGSEPVV